jgi:hypothetical protein
MSVGGIGWVEMTAAVWMAAVWVATAMMAFRVKEAYAGDSFRRLHLLAARPHNDVFWSVWLEVKLAVANQLQLGRRLRLLVQ